ncbi:longitudinals lacking protein, isoforms H/M/V isoform X7 [Bradysia coprophila]|uniref:longitudinals lacking protein, isoforms H/M/V isoform X7 n=1 Tax=Bradysia coprophila TaxID=38358 RepID=UPI00187DC071|nr:longitudinals lacking protein, isoforms H/M/V isoform X7 [Bradysia coprophila]
MDDDQQFCLRWNNHQSTLISVFDTLLENGTLVDCTLAAEGKFLKAHKVVLSACSPYFAALLSQQYDKHPIFILKDIKFQELRAMMDYMYRGEVNISQDQLAALLKAAESLQIKGLSESRGGSTQKNENVVQKQPVPVVSKSGLTIEHKRPANKHPTSAATESDVSMSREGSTSPTSRKRKKFRRRSIEVNNMDNHDQLSNSSSQSQSIHMTSIPMTAASQITSATSAANVLNVTKKTDHHDSKKDMEQSQADDDEDDDKNDLEPPAQRQKHDMDVSHIKEKMQSTHSELLIEPKNEYDDGQDETVEDLTLDDEELLEDLDQAGPSHGGEGSSQGYAQWQVGQNQDEVFLAAQEAAGQHRDAQGLPVVSPSYFPFNFSSATTAPPPQPSQTPNSLWLLSPTAIENFDLRSLLNCVKGQEILSHYENEKTLGALMRKNLITLVVDYFVTNRIKVGTKDCNVLADKIVKLFPNEEKSNYFIAGSGKMNARGGLYIKYNNQIRLYRCKGLIEATPKRSKWPVDNQQPTDDTDMYSDHDVTIEVKREVCDIEDYNS